MKTSPGPSPSHNGLLGTPWRHLDWNQRRTMKEALRSLKTSTTDVGELRILIHGPVGAGKSNFINSIDSIFQERMTSGALVEAATDRSFTKIFQTHFIRDQGYRSFLPFAFCDIMGMEDGHCEGVNTDDLKKILEGHIRDGYVFNPWRSCSEDDPHYNRSPKLGDRIHCLVSVVPAIKISLMEDPIIDKIKEVRAEATRLRIPQVTVLTKVDEMCPEVAKDIKLVYRSKKIREKMQDCSNRLGITMNCIFPVKNYHEEIHLNNDVDVVLLSALTTILNFANDHVAEMAATPPPVADVRDSSSRDELPPEEQPPPVPPRTYKKSNPETPSALVKVGGSKHYNKQYDFDNDQHLHHHQLPVQTGLDMEQRYKNIPAAKQTSGNMARPPGNKLKEETVFIHQEEHIRELKQVIQRRWVDQ